MDNLSVQSLLAALDFGDKEIQVYLALAELGKAQAHLIAKRAGVPRTSAYAVLAKLVEKGVTSVEQREGVSFYAANPPASLLSLVKRKKEALQDLENQT